MLDILALIDELNTKFNGSLKASDDGKAIIAEKGEIKPLLSILKEEQGFNMLVDITSVDYEKNFTVVYHLMSQSNAELIRIKTDLPPENPEIESVTGLWKSADVMEREIFDLMGIVFKGHENLKRILCPDDFEGHPLQKSFKLKIQNRFE